MKSSNLKGEKGGIYESGTSVVTGSFEAILALEATVIASATSTNITGDALTAVPLPAGCILYGAFSSVTLTSGKVILYHADTL